MRLPDGELEEWKRRAEAAGIKLAAWIRERCNADGKTDSSIGASDAESGRKVPEGVRGPEREPYVREGAERVAKTCPHGIAKDWRCTLCGGIVK